MKKYLIAAAIACAVAAPAMADDVGVRVGPVGVGVTVGEHDRDRDRDSTTVIKEHEPESKTVIKKEDDMGNREKTVNASLRIATGANLKLRQESFDLVGAFLSLLRSVIRIANNWRRVARNTPGIGNGLPT